MTGFNNFIGFWVKSMEFPRVQPGRPFSLLFLEVLETQSGCLVGALGSKRRHTGPEGSQRAQEPLLRG